MFSFNKFMIVRCKFLDEVMEIFIVFTVYDLRFWIMNVLPKYLSDHPNCDKSKQKNETGCFESCNGPNVE